MKKNYIILIILGISVTIGLIFGVYYWFQFIEKPGSKPPPSWEQEETGSQPEINYPPGGEKEFFLKLEKEGRESLK